MLQRMVRGVLLATLFSANVSIALATSLASTTNNDVRALYGDEILFDVYREGDLVGFHKVEFSESGDRLQVRSTFSVQIDFLFFTAFRYLYQSDAEWRDGALERLEASVDDDGTKSSLFAIRDGREIRIEQTNLRYRTSAPVFPTNHWNAGVLDQSRVLNTLTGRINEVEIVSQGRDTVPTESGMIEVTRFAYTGDLQNEIWYDDAGRWVKMRFSGRDGTPIDYVCRRCQGGETKSGTSETRVGKPES